MTQRTAKVVVFDMKGEDHGDIIIYEVDADKFQREYERMFPFTCSEDLCAIHEWLKQNGKETAKITPDYCFTMPIQ